MSAEKDTGVKQPADYSGEERYNRGRALVISLLRWLECELFGLFIFLSILAMRVILGRAGDIIFGLLGLAAYVMVMADHGFKEGSKAHTKNVVRGDNVGRGFGWLLGLVSVIPPLVSLAVLGISFSGSSETALPVFKAANAGLWGLINLFAPDMDLAHLSPAIFIVFPAIQLLLAAVTAAAFRVGHSGSDLQTWIMYKKGK